MKITKTPLQGAYVFGVDRIEDDRGFFGRAWCKNELAEHGLNTDLAQANVAFNNTKGTLRGMHRQLAPHAEVKVVRCSRGAVFDAIVDLRPDSPTFTNWFGLELSAQNHLSLYVPKGFGHGYLTLEDNSEVHYQVSDFYAPGHEAGCRWNDPAFGIEWPDTGGYLISDKDQAWPDFQPDFTQEQADS